MLMCFEGAGNVLGRYYAQVFGRDWAPTKEREEEEKRNQLQISRIT